MFNNNKITTSKYSFKSPKIDGKIKIAHLSDLHEKKFGEANRELFDAVAELSPDAIMLTGDIIAHERQKRFDSGYAYELGAGLARIAPTFFVTGNHERAFDAQVKQALLNGGVNMAAQGLITVEIGKNKLNIGGIDDPTYAQPEIGAAVRQFAGREGYNVFLTHQPQVFQYIKDKNIDLVLAGHTHAGQIRIPFFSDVFMFGQGFFPKYMRGEFQENGTAMVVSRGLGASGYPPVRFNNPPDLVSIEVSGN